MIYRLLLFLVINFAGLAIGSIFTKPGAKSEWYRNRKKAPWTPPGWIFGAAWTTVMICFSIYLALLWPEVQNLWLLMGAFVLQWLLNVVWNPVFFFYHKVFAGLMIVSLLTVVIGLMLVGYWSQMHYLSLLLLPYFVWLLVAVSLNGYTWVKK
ncbi:MAG: TspO/MBR family protein [Bacteroidota bacterium]